MKVSKFKSFFIILYCKISPIYFNFNIWIRRNLNKCFNHEK